VAENVRHPKLTAGELPLEMNLSEILPKPADWGSYGDRGAKGAKKQRSSERGSSVRFGKNCKEKKIRKIRPVKPGEKQKPPGESPNCRHEGKTKLFSLDKERSGTTINVLGSGQGLRERGTFQLTGKGRSNFGQSLQKNFLSGSRSTPGRGRGGPVGVERPGGRHILGWVDWRLAYTFRRRKGGKSKNKGHFWVSPD